MCSLFLFSTSPATWWDMTAEEFVSLLEELIDLKVQQRNEARLKPNPELAGVLQAKRETDRRRLDEIRVELVKILNPQT